MKNVPSRSVRSKLKVALFDQQAERAAARGCLFFRDRTGTIHHAPPATGRRRDG
jgi:hypothetical protein